MVLNPLKALSDDCDKSVPAQQLIKGKIKNTHQKILVAKSNDSLKLKYKELDEQAIIMIVSAFEDFMSQMFIYLTESYAKYINWSGKIGLELDQLKYRPRTSLSELIYTSLKSNGQVNFQDLQSTVKYLDERVGIDPNKIFTDNSLKEKIILFQAIRHSLIHNQGRVDPRFLNQIRNTSFLKDFEKNEELSIDTKMVKECNDAFLSLAKNISGLIDVKIKEWEPPIVINGVTINIDDIPF